MLIQNYIKRLDSIPNACIDYIILLTSPKKVSFAKLVFKIKIDKIIIN